MTTLIIDKIEMPAAKIGHENPLPRFRELNPNVHYDIDDNVPQSDRKYMGWQTAFRILPHRMQDTYSRDKKPRVFLAAILENEYLRAVVLPEIGGRLASLVHKQSGIELLEPVKDFQPTNVALRDAWIAGGIEWNTAQMGHHYLTCSPVFTARVDGDDGEPVLRLYAWDRAKCFPYQVDLHLPSGSEFLFARVRIINPHDYELPMYWWTNIAAPQSPDRRVLMPADTTIHNAPNGLKLVDMPMLESGDLTYATNSWFAKEFFFRVSESDRPWIACLDKRGEGLVQTSTSMLKGRKLFAWGTSRGGQRWQEHLLGPGREYLEIQAGLARTQLESLPMPAKTEWSWTEAFGLLQVDPDKAHSTNWPEARQAAASVLESALPQAELDRLHSEFAKVSTKAPTELISMGDGWGSLEQMRASVCEEEQSIPSELPFPEDCIGDDQAQWLGLLHNGVLPERDTNDEPGFYMVQPEWQTLLEKSIKRGDSDNWFGWLHMGTMKLENFDTDGARKAWNRSIACKPSAWAYRNLAVLETRDKHLDSACDLMQKAWEIGPKVSAFAIEYSNVLEQAKRWDDLRDFYNSLPEHIKNNERILIVSAKLALHYGELDGVEKILNHKFASIRENEFILTDLWFAWQAKLASEKEGVPMSDELIARVKKELTPPLQIDLRTSG